MKENIERYNPNIEEGLSNNQVEKRKKEGLLILIQLLQLKA